MKNVVAASRRAGMATVSVPLPGNERSGQLLPPQSRGDGRNATLYNHIILRVASVCGQERGIQMWQSKQADFEFDFEMQLR